MTTVTIKVSSLDDVKRDTIAALKGDKTKQGNFITFLSWEDLYKTLSPKRMALLNAMTGAGELTFRELASMVGRDVKAVHTDVTALINCGVVDRGNNGVVFPYDAIHFDFTVSKVAA